MSMYWDPHGGDMVIYSMLHRLGGECWSGDSSELHQDMLEDLRLQCEDPEMAGRVLL